MTDHSPDGPSSDGWSGVGPTPLGPRPLADGTYDAIVVDAAERGPGTIALDLTILAGDRKGEVVTLAGPAGDHDPDDLLGIPATITVADDRPRLRLEP